MALPAYYSPNTKLNTESKRIVCIILAAVLGFISVFLLLFLPMSLPGTLPTLFFTVGIMLVLLYFGVTLKEKKTPTVGDLVENEYWEPSCGMHEHKKRLELFEKRLEKHMIKEGYKKRRIASSRYGGDPLLFILDGDQKELLPLEEARVRLRELEEEVDFSRI